MSRIGKLPINIPSEVKVEISGLRVKVHGPKGQLTKSFVGQIAIESNESSLIIKSLDDSVQSKSMWGTARSIINSMVIGVTNGFEKELLVNGVGYRASVKGKYLNLTLGKSHNTKIEIPSDVQVRTPKQNIILLNSHDKEKLGQYTAIIRSQRPPEPYKGKGIRSKDEYVQRKEGKKG